MKFPQQVPAIMSVGAASLVLSWSNSPAAASDIRCEKSPPAASIPLNDPFAFVPNDDSGSIATSKAVSTENPGEIAYFVAPHGNDTWSGRRPDASVSRMDGPFATIERARDAIRADKGRRPGLSGTIYLRGGRYELERPLVLTAQDAGTRLMAFKNEHPELSGAKSIPAVAQSGTGRFEATLPENPGQELFVGGIRQTIAFKPSPYADGWRPVESQKADNSFGFLPGTIDANGGSAVPDVEMMDDSRSRNLFTKIVSLDTAQSVAQVAPGTQDSFPRFAGYRLIGNPNWIRNGDQFGWNDAARLLILKPTAVSALMASGVQLPVLHSLVIFREARDNIVQGLRFIETATAPPDELKRAAVTLQGSRNIRVSGNDFRNVGEAVRLIESSRNFVQDNDIRDVGSHGIELQDQSDGNLISGNKLTAIGRIELNAAAIYLHGASSNRIARNIVRDSSRHGIGIDNWDDTTVNRANIVEFNQLRQTNQDTDDSGAIEMLGRSRIDTSSIIRFNQIGDVGKPEPLNPDDRIRNAAISGIYLDDLTSGVLVCGNRIQGAPLAAIHIHGGSMIEVRDNIAILDRPGSNFVFLQSATPSSGGQRFDFQVNLPSKPQQGPIQAALSGQDRGAPVRTRRVAVRFDNDDVIGAEDRDLFVGKIKIGDREFLPTDPLAHYLVDGKPTLPGQEALPWNGALTWDLPADAFDPSDLTLSVFAWGNPAGGVGAHFVVTLDGVRVGEGTAGSPADEMQSNRITRNIVYVTGTGAEYFKSLRGGAPQVTANDYFDTTGKLQPPTSPVADTAPLAIDPGFIDPARGDFRLRPSSALRARGFGDLPALSGNGS